MNTSYSGGCSAFGFAPSETVICNITQQTKKELKYPMPTYCLKDKLYNARAYGVLMLNSKGGNLNLRNNNRYTYKNSMDIELIAKELRISKTTLERNIKKLEKMDCSVLEVENTKNGIVYRLNYGIKSSKNEDVVNKYVRINEKMLKTLISAFNSNAIKVYCLLCYKAKDCSFTAITNAFLCEQIGLSAKSHRNIGVITDITTQLELCGFIETVNEHTHMWQGFSESVTCKKKYRLRTFEEWQEIQTFKSSK